jgi:hypothetical protein
LIYEKCTSHDLSWKSDKVDSHCSNPNSCSYYAEVNNQVVVLTIAMAFVTCYFFQVMTDEQMETLRRQISVYSTICQQLVEMHKACLAQQPPLPGIMIGGQLPYDQMGTPNHKPTTRLRWTPSQIQLQILEKLFEQGNGTPNKQHIKEITDELRRHGQITETNVYNWFQNRKARAKRRHQQVCQNCRTHLNQARGALQVT